MVRAGRGGRVAGGVLALWLLGCGVGRGEAALIELDYRGGAPTDAADRDPSLRLHADGRLELGDLGGRMAPLSTTFARARVLDLVEEIVERQRFFEIDGDRLRDELRELARESADHARSPAPPDSPDTVIRVWRHEDGDPHEVAIGGLDHLARAYPDSDALGRLAAVRRALERLRSEAYAAEEPGLAHYLALVEAERARLFPDHEPFAESDLEAAARYPGGDAVLTFARPAEGEAGRTLAARLVDPASGDVTVEVYLTRTVRAGDR